MNTSTPTALEQFKTQLADGKGYNYPNGDKLAEIVFAGEHQTICEGMKKDSTPEEFTNFRNFLWTLIRWEGGDGPSPTCAQYMVDFCTKQECT